MATYSWVSVKVLLLMAPSHYLNLYWLVNSEVLCHSPESIFRGYVQNILDTIVENLELRSIYQGPVSWFTTILLPILPLNTGKTECTQDECGPLNSLLSREITWWHRSVPTLAQVKGLLPDDTKPLLEPILVSHLWYSVAFTWGQFHKKCCRYLSLIWVWKLLMVHTGNKYHIYV